MGMLHRLVPVKSDRHRSARHTRCRYQCTRTRRRRIPAIRDETVLRGRHDAAKDSDGAASRPLQDLNRRPSRRKFQLCAKGERCISGGRAFSSWLRNSSLQLVRVACGRTSRFDHFNTTPKEPDPKRKSNSRVLSGAFLRLTLPLLSLGRAHSVESHC